MTTLDTFTHTFPVTLSGVMLARRLDYISEAAEIGSLRDAVAAVAGDEVDWLSTSTGITAVIDVLTEAISSLRYAATMAETYRDAMTQALEVQS